MIFRKRALINMKTSLGNIPRGWLQNVEPKVMRGSWLPCWVWMGATDRNGYPLMSDGSGGKVMAHRYVAKLFYEFDEASNVRRTCNTVNCVNPNHLLITNNHHTQENP